MQRVLQQWALSHLSTPTYLSVLVKRMAGKSISKMTDTVSSGM